MKQTQQQQENINKFRVCFVLATISVRETSPTVWLVYTGMFQWESCILLNPAGMNCKWFLV